MPSAEPTSAPRFGTFAGVFRPVFLAILGAMLYLREGWVVGQAGLLGAALIIGAALAITLTTALSLSSIASNVRLRPGGAFAIISQALGLEAGGAIGVPLFLAQAASSAMYVYAFSEGWGFLFPDHPGPVVAGLAFLALSTLAWTSASLAFRAQSVLFVVIAVALASALGGLLTADTLHTPTALGDLPSSSPTSLFALFFPAATGIMVGVGMSGDLHNPRRSIPRGTLFAWLVTSAVYLGFAVWYAVIASPDELLTNRTVMIDRAAVPALVLAGLLCSTAMAALSSLVAAPRLLQAMAAQNVIPGSTWLSRTSPSGEPRNASITTIALGAIGLAAGSLDAIAPVITSFFIMTYLAINGVVWLEQSLGMISFRPSFRIPPFVPLIGVALCLGGLSLASPFGGVVEVLMVLGIYAGIGRRHLDTPWETVRSGVAVTIAAWAARRAAHIQRVQRAWKPDLLVPVAAIAQARDLRPWCEDLARRNGSLRWVALGPNDELPEALPSLVQHQNQAGLHSTWTRLRTDRYMDGIGLALDALQGALFPPNLVVVDERRVNDHELADYLRHCRRLGVGLAVWQPHPQGGMGEQRTIAVWVSDRGPEWKLDLQTTNLDLPVLVAILLSEAWGARLQLRCAVREATSTDAARAFLHRLADQARLPKGTEIHVFTTPFEQALAQPPSADLHLLGMPPVLAKARLAQVHEACGGACLWLLDSGQESALA